ncbi:C6 transcription factor, putative [Trichophyton benhamiae CBS 112371]|uniref:C6 transcription factor, putative n=2 Tax=Trichophyton TaxID=5550 RepID=D4AZB1_ARTBC|nr:C6 transcription factor, putative [Trichophyton benhamiae CBS 112371]XP_003021650.1 C6 transcription factor, putative [Trichophyton verrucosum HKI 0517]EFE31631.1 C6 transcription factor, putative [Trichophyton benhamiae CBS 112371]EFE41032.1 C6 transcription factor, putative [Trichophyton verrucosum HKI 0517]
MLHIKDEISEIPDIESHALKEGILQAQRKVGLLVDQRDEELSRENSPPTNPPFAILDAMIGPYFATTNHHFPIWTKERFIRMATNLRQSTSPDPDLASIICCNNLVLMAMSADSLCSYRREPMPSKQARKPSSIDCDIVEGFLANAKRALKNIDQLISPRLINVQALLSMYIVAQEHLSKGLSETLFALAAQCAKSIGIHQWNSFRGGLTDEDVEERRNISYCLYVLDKAVCWTAGSSPNIPATDMYFDPCLTPSERNVVSCLVAKTEMAKIEETVYLEVYANQVKAKNEDQVREFATTILSRLQSWLADSGIDFDKIQNFPKSSAPNLQLAIRYLCVQLLLIWPHKKHPDGIFQRGQEVAKMCMKYLICLWNSPPDQGNHAIFPLSVYPSPVFVVCWLEDVKI